MAAFPPRCGDTGEFCLKDADAGQSGARLQSGVCFMFAGSAERSATQCDYFCPLDDRGELEFMQLSNMTTTLRLPSLLK